MEYDGPLNKERITKEYLKRIKKIWSSELNSLNKVIAHNTFAVPVLAPTFSILDWTRSELSEIDVRTRKLMSMTRSVHVNSDVDMLYLSRRNGERGLQNITEVYKARIVSLKQHIEQEVSKGNKLLQLVWNHEQEPLIKVADELEKYYNIKETPEQQNLRQPTTSKQKSKRQYRRII